MAQEVLAGYFGATLCLSPETTTTTAAESLLESTSSVTRRRRRRTPNSLLYVTVLIILLLHPDSSLFTHLLYMLILQSIGLLCLFSSADCIK